MIADEFPHLVVHYPILLTKDQDTGAFLCGAMLGFDEGENLFLERSGMKPIARSICSAVPFSPRAAKWRSISTIRASMRGGKPLFTENGEPTQYLQSIMALFRDLKPGLE